MGLFKRAPAELRERVEPGVAVRFTDVAADGEGVQERPSASAAN